MVGSLSLDAVGALGLALHEEIGIFFNMWYSLSIFYSHFYLVGFFGTSAFLC